MEQGAIAITLNGTVIRARDGQSIVEAARESGTYIPKLCDYKSLPPARTSRICTGKGGGRLEPGCTPPVTHEMVADTESE